MSPGSVVSFYYFMMRILICRIACRERNVTFLVTETVKKDNSYVFDIKI